MRTEQSMGIKGSKAQMSQSALSPKAAPTAGGVTAPGVSMPAFERAKQAMLDYVRGDDTAAERFKDAVAECVPGAQS